MDAKEYLKGKFIDNTVSVVTVIPGVSKGYFKLTDLLESYHQAKSKEEAEERYGVAVIFFNGKEYNSTTILEGLRIASGKDES